MTPASAAAILGWRTWSGLLILGGMMLAALVLCRDRANGPALLSTTVTGLTGLGLWLASKSAVQHVATAAAAAKAGEPAASILAKNATGPT